MPKPELIILKGESSECLVHPGVLKGREPKMPEDQHSHRMSWKRLLYHRNERQSVQQGWILSYPWDLTLGFDCWQCVQ